MTSRSTPAPEQPPSGRKVERSWKKWPFRASSSSRPSSSHSESPATPPAGLASPPPPPDTRPNQTAIPRVPIIQALALFPPLQSVTEQFIEIMERIQDENHYMATYESLASELRNMIDALNQYTNEFGSEDPDGNIARIVSSIEKETKYIRRKQDHSKTRRYLELVQGQDGLPECQDRVNALYRQLVEILRKTENRSEENLLRGLSPEEDARYNSSYSIMIKREGCTAQTRREVQADLHEWAKDPDAAKVYWISGIAGTGKTTIAYSLCEWLDAGQQLGASFFCSRTKDSCSDVGRIVPTIASQLAQHSRSFRLALCKVLKEVPDFNSLNLMDQFKKLVQEPMEEVKLKDGTRRGAVVVIEALDECKDGSSTQLILQMLLNLGKNLPLKFCVTSRSEPPVQNETSAGAPGGYSLNSSDVKHLRLHDIEEWIVEEDLKIYLTQALGFLSPRPSQNDIQLLVKCSRKLFIYAATVVRYLQASGTAMDASARLQTVLAIGSISVTGDGANSDYSELDRLYATILATTFHTDLGHHDIETRQHVLRMVVRSRDIITIQTLASTLGHTEQEVASALSSLQPMLHLPDGNGTVSTLHTSFPEYLLDKSRSGGLQWHCNVVQTPQKPLPKSSTSLQSKGMSALQMFQCLLKHGCPDLTQAIDPNQFSSSLITGGSFGDIWKGRLYDGTSVAVKVWRFASINEDGEKTLKRAMRELYNWSKTDHENVHKLLGVTMFQGRLGMVSRWMEHGNLRDYIGKNNSADRYQLCIQVAKGVHYLHSQSMVHGDLKACNILVSSEGVPKLTDFDHSIISDCSLIFSATTQMGGGTLRWMAPELVIETPHPNQRNKRTDIYALGMTLLEIITGTIPYQRQCRNDANVLSKLIHKILPERTDDFQNQRGDRMWALLVRCWDHDPAARPAAHEVVEQLELLIKEATPVTLEA